MSEPGNACHVVGSLCTTTVAFAVINLASLDLSE
jgi:hypothetical protein